jgi:hypothetical protein
LREKSITLIAGRRWCWAARLAKVASLEPSLTQIASQLAPRPSMTGSSRRKNGSTFAASL